MKIKKAYYNVPNGVSLQRRPWKLASNIYPVEANESLKSNGVNIVLGEMKQVLFVIFDDLSSKGILLESIELEQVLFEPIHDKNQDMQKYKTIGTMLVNNSPPIPPDNGSGGETIPANNGNLSVVQVLFDPVYYTNKDIDLYKTLNTTLVSGSIVQTLWEPIRHTNVKPEKHTSSVSLLAATLVKTIL